MGANEKLVSRKFLTFYGLLLNRDKYWSFMGAKEEARIIFHILVCIVGLNKVGLNKDCWESF